MDTAQLQSMARRNGYSFSMTLAALSLREMIVLDRESRTVMGSKKMSPEQPIRGSLSVPQLPPQKDRHRSTYSTTLRAA